MMMKWWDGGGGGGGGMERGAVSGLLHMIHSGIQSERAATTQGKLFLWQWQRENRTSPTTRARFQPLLTSLNLLLAKASHVGKPNLTRWGNTQHPFSYWVKSWRAGKKYILSKHLIYHSKTYCMRIHM